MRAGGRITEHRLAGVRVRAQRFKAKFSITVMLISARAKMSFDCVMRRTGGGPDTRVVEISAVDMQNGSALQAFEPFLIIMDFFKVKKKKRKNNHSQQRLL